MKENKRSIFCFGEQEGVADMTAGIIAEHLGAGERVLLLNFCGDSLAGRFEGFPRLECLSARAINTRFSELTEEQRGIALLDNTDLMDNAQRLIAAAEPPIGLLVLHGASDAVSNGVLYKGILTDFLAVERAGLSTAVTGCEANSELAYYCDEIYFVQKVQKTQK